MRVPTSAVVLMTPPTIDRGSAAPLLSVLAVRDGLEPLSDLRPFECQVQAAIRCGADAGSLEMHGS